MGSRFGISAIAGSGCAVARTKKQSRKRNGKRNLSTHETAREHWDDRAH
jgi:hypothetical protein